MMLNQCFIVNEKYKRLNKLTMHVCSVRNQNAENANHIKHYCLTGRETSIRINNNIIKKEMLFILLC